MITYMNDYNEGIQICIVFTALGIFQVMHIRNKPYYTATLNFLQGMSLIVMSMFLVVRLMIRTFGIDKDLASWTAIVGTISTAPIPEDLVNIRRIEVEGDVSLQIYIACLSWIGLFFIAIL